MTGDGDDESPLEGKQPQPDGSLEETLEATRTGRPGFLKRFLRLTTVDVTPLLRYHDFRLLFAGQAISFFGSMITFVALPYQLYQLTHSSLAVGLLGIFEIAPILLFAFVGGALADARDRRQMVLITELGLAILSLVLIVNAALPHPQVWLLYAVASLMAALDALQRPSLDALMPRLVERADLMAAGALSSLRMTVGMIAGPAIGGVLVALVGLSGTYAVDVATFLVSLVALRAMRSVPPPPEAEPPSLRRVVEGLRYARSRPELMGTYLIDMVAMFFGMREALFPALASQHGGARVLGLLYAAPAAGSFIATATSGWTRRVHRHGRAVVFAALSWGAAITLFGVSNWLPLSLVFLGLAGGADMISGLFRSLIWNQTIPDALRGRLAGIELISYSSGPTLGNVEAGTVASIFGIRASIISGGAMCVVGTGLLALALPLFYRYDGRASSEQVVSAPAGT